MKKCIALLLCALLLTGCGARTIAETVPAGTTALEATYPELVPVAQTPEEAYVSRFSGETAIALSDDGITVNGGPETEAVHTSHDIVYYEDRLTYESGNPYGEGEPWQRHSAEEAAAHTVVNITEPGAYRLSGKLSAGQIRIDLGGFAFDDPEAVVELILDGVDLTCTVAPAILFRNTYECDNRWSVETASADVDTSAAGAVLVLAGENTVTGSHVAKIYKDAEGEKKRTKEDGAIYSYMSLNVYGPGSLLLNADNEGLDTELHLTLYGGDIAIRSGNDGINTNEDGVSVTAIQGGRLRILAGLNGEGDGIDSNGYLVIRGGTVLTSAHPAADAGLDSDLGTFIHGGTVLALGSSMDQAEKDSRQVTLNLQFSRSTSGNLTLVREDGQVLFACDPAQDPFFSESRSYQGVILSSPYLTRNTTFHLFTDSTFSGSQSGGIYDIFSLTDLTGGTRMQYTSTASMGFGRPGAFPEGMEIPEGMEFPGGGFEDRRPEGDLPTDFTMPADFEGMEPPQGFEGQMPSMPEGFEGFGDRQPPEGDFPQGDFPQGSAQEPDSAQSGGSVDFLLSSTVNSFSGILPEA